MKKLKKLICLLISLLMLTMLLQTTVFAEATDTMSEDFKKILNKDGKLVLNSFKPTTQNEFECINEMMLVINQGEYCIISPNSDYTKCTVVKNYYQPNEERHEVEIVYNYDPAVKQILDQSVNKFPNELKFFGVYDMELVNYWLNENIEDDDSNTRKTGSSFDNYSSELKNYTNSKNFDLVVDNRAGEDSEFVTSRIGFAMLQYKGIIYYVHPMLGVSAKHIIYVPDDTGDTKEELRAAAQKRMNDYAGVGKITVNAEEKTIEQYYNDYYTQMKQEAQNKLDLENAKETPNMMNVMQYQMEVQQANDYMEYFQTAYNTPTGDMYFLRSAEGGYYFSTTINGIKHYFMVVKDSNKMVNPTYKTQDVVTNVEIATNSSDLPLDSIIEANELENGEQYDKIIRMLDLDSNETFDLKLFSNCKSDYVSRLDDGTFEVKIPISEELEGKNLSVYYINSNDKLVTYDVTMDHGFAKFITDHFSIYTLAESGAQIVDKNEKDVTPKTGNIVNLNYIIAGIGVTALVALVVIKNKK